MDDTNNIDRHYWPMLTTMSFKLLVPTYGNRLPTNTLTARHTAGAAKLPVPTEYIYKKLNMNNRCFVFNGTTSRG
jgi:hypothetical protein